MLIRKNISLKRYNTFGLDYKAECMIIFKTEKDARAIFSGNIPVKKPLLIIGGGSNLLFTGDFSGTILYPDFRGIRVEKDFGDTVIVSSGAGVNWDDLVEWTVNKGLGGLENLSLIPGKVGAASVQNIGAYGVEVKDCIEKVRAIDIRSSKVRVFYADDCKFNYRDSIFKRELKNRCLITRVYFKLSKVPRFTLDYGLVREETKNTGEISLKNIRQAIISIRSSKLPDPLVIGNAGSFFKNPLVSIETAKKLKTLYPAIPCYNDSGEKVKISGGWLIEQCGWKGKRIGDAGVHSLQSLVLVNHGEATGRDIYDLSEKIRKSVLEKFGIELEREAEVIKPT